MAENDAKQPITGERPKGLPSIRSSIVYDDDVEFLPDRAVALLTHSPRGARSLIWLLVLFFAAAVAWAYWAELDEITRGIGKVVASRQLQVVQNLEGGIISEILVKEGDVVSVGQPLLKIDDVRFASSYREGALRYQALQAKVARLSAEAAGDIFDPSEELTRSVPEIIKQERELFNSRRQQQQANIQILEQQVSQRYQELEELKAKRRQLAGSLHLAVKELNLMQPLLEDGAVPEVDVLRLKREVSQLRGDLEGTRHAIPRSESRLDEAKRKIEEAKLAFLNAVREELNETTSEMRRLHESNTALEDRVQRTTVRSPVVGKVQRLMVNTLRGVVQPGMDLVEIVPLEDSLIVEVQIKPQDIGFLHTGLRAQVKFTAYDFSIYGGLEGTVEYISADSITDEKGETFFLARIRTQKNYLGNEEKKLSIMSGMQATVDILTGEKTVLEYLMKPVLRARAYALKER